MHGVGAVDLGLVANMIERRIPGLGGLWAALALFWAGPACAAGYEGLAEQLDPAVTEAVKKADVAGLSIAVIDAQGVVWRGSFGSVAASPDALYRAPGL